MPPEHRGKNRVITLIEKFNNQIVPSLMKELNLNNKMAVPKIEKIVLTCGFGSVKEDKQKMKYIEKEIEKFVGQKVKYDVSKVAVSSFKLREGQKIAYSVTLRGRRMYLFLDKLINISLPRIKDFRGLKNKSFDGHGNYSIGIREHTVMPEIKYEELLFPFGIQVNIATTASNDKTAMILLKQIGFPFEKE